MRSDALDALVLHLQAADLTVGIDTQLRLRVLFTQAGLPDDPERVANMVAAIVAHHAQEAQTARDATLAWLRQAPVPMVEPSETADAVQPPPADAKSSGVSIMWYVLIAGAAALVWWIWQADPAGTVIRKGVDVVQSAPPTNGVPWPISKQPASGAVPFLKEAPALEILVEPPLPAQRDATWPFWALACFGLGVAFHGWRQTRPPGEPVPPPGPELPPRRPRPRAARQPRFVTGRDADTLAWGIDRYLTDEPTGRLDLNDTVIATVRAGGLPALRWARAQQHRDIWLWIDDAAVRAHPEIAQLTAEVQQALARVGLRPKVAHFWGVPDALNHEGNALRIDQLEEARMSARVAVLTDGRLWTRWRSEPARKREADRALRRLAGWRQLAVFDFGAAQWAIADLLQQHGITAAEPADLIGWLGEFDTRTTETCDDDRIAWAAACALCPEPVSEDDALMLLQALGRAGVDASPWSIRDLREEAPGPGRRLRWSPGQRAELLTWMCAAEKGEDSLLAHAQRFWQARLQGRDPRRVAQRAWLDLFTTPKTALATLLRLTHEADDDQHQPVAVGADVTHALPRDLAGPSAIALPWRWADLDAHSRLQARAIGLGRAVGGLPDEVLVRPGRVGLSTGLGAGVALAAVIFALWPAAEQRAKKPRVVENAVGATVEMDRKGRYVIARTPWMDVFQTNLEPGAQLRIVEGVRQCEERIDGARLLRCGTRPRPVKVNPSVLKTRKKSGPKLRYTVAVIAARSNRASERLAAQLLDTGSVDAVLIQADARLEAPLERLPGLKASTTHGLFFGGIANAKPAQLPTGWCRVPGQLEGLASALGDGATMQPGDVWPVVSGGKECPEVRGRTADWQRQLRADRAALEAALESDYPLENALAALVYVPDELMWSGSSPLGWSLLGAKTADAFQAAIDARLRLIDEMMQGTDQAQAQALVKFLGQHPEAFEGVPGTEASKALNGAALDRYNAVLQEANRRQQGWRRVTIRKTAKMLFTVNQRVVGDFPFGRSQSDASVDNAAALFNLVRALAGQYPGDRNTKLVTGTPGPFKNTWAAALLGRNQGEWIRGFEELVVLNNQIGRWPISIKGELPQGAYFTVETSKGSWRRAHEWQPGQKIRVCAPEPLQYQRDGNEEMFRPVPNAPNCFSAKGDWAFLRIVDHDKPLSKFIRAMTSGVFVGGSKTPGFVPKAVDFPKLPADPPRLKPASGDACPYTCQMKGWPKGERVGEQCQCGE